MHAKSWIRITPSLSDDLTIERGTRMSAPGVEYETTRPWPTWWQRLWWWIWRKPRPKTAVVPVRKVRR